MTLTPVMIAPFATGLNTDTEPWISPVDSFSEIDNLHIHHGKVQKREGFRPFGSLIPMGATVATTGITQAFNGIVTTAAAHGAVTGDKVFITGVAGMTSVNNKIYTVTLIDATNFSINLNTTDLAAYSGPGTIAVIDDSTDRVMGITRYIETNGAKTTLAFNANRAYRFDTATNTFAQLDAANIFSSGEYNFIWSANWQSGGGTNRLYFTNGKAGTPEAAPTSDGIRYYDGTTDANNTVSFYPTLSNAGAATKRTLVGCELIFSLGQRLICLNTDEYNTVSTDNFPQRARWCAKQNPANWDDVTAGGGGYTDAATGDQIVSARALQNQIIVFFTNSVWSLTATSDPNRAFKWQRINNFRACDGKMASVSFDKYASSIGIRGITATDGVETKRIDPRIDTFTSDTINVDEFKKVFCERSYANKRWWTLFNNLETTDNENDSALIYDDDSGAFTTYSIAMNCLGYGNFSQDFGLDDFTVANDLDSALSDFDDEDLFSYFWQDNQETLLGGDINGDIFVMETDGDDDSLAITSEFITAAWNPFNAEGIECQMNYIDFYVDTHPSTKATISFFKDTQTTPYITQEMNFLPNLNFVASIVDADATNPVNVNAPSHGLTTNDTIYIYGIEKFLGTTGMTAINSGESADGYTITIVDENNFTLDGIDGTSFGAYGGGGKIYLKRFYRTKTWKRVFGGGIGHQHKIKFSSTGKDKPFTIHAMKPVFKARGKRNIN